jgi:hypothetical protein
VIAAQSAFVEKAARNCLLDREGIVVILPDMSSSTLGDTHKELSGRERTPIVVTGQRVLILHWRHIWRGRRTLGVSGDLASRPGSWLRPRWVINLIDAPSRHEVDLVELLPRQSSEWLTSTLVDILVLKVCDQTVQFDCIADRWSKRLALAVDTLSKNEAPRPV